MTLGHPVVRCRRDDKSMRIANIRALHMHLIHIAHRQRRAAIAREGETLLVQLVKEGPWFAHVFHGRDVLSAKPRRGRAAVSVGNSANEAAYIERFVDA